MESNYATLTIFSYQCIVTLTFNIFDAEIHRAHPLFIESLCAKFHDDQSKGKVVMPLDHLT